MNTSSNLIVTHALHMSFLNYKPCYSPRKQVGVQLRNVARLGPIQYLGNVFTIPMKQVKVLCGFPHVKYVGCHFES